MRTKLSKMRADAGYTQYSFAKALGVSRSHYSQIETGAKNPSLTLSMKIKMLLRYTGDDLFSITEQSVTKGRPIR